MTRAPRLRAITAKDCLTCRRRLGPSATFEERRKLAIHRNEHARADRRREQWRIAKGGQPSDERAIGYLHELGCHGNHYNIRGGCRPIPVYRGAA